MSRFVREICSSRSPMHSPVTSKPQCSVPFHIQESGQISLPSHVLKDKVCLGLIMLAILHGLIKALKWHHKICVQLSQQILDLFHACEQQNEDLEKKERCRAQLQIDIQRLFPCMSDHCVQLQCKDWWALYEMVLCLIQVRGYSWQGRLWTVSGVGPVMLIYVLLFKIDQWVCFSVSGNITLTGNRLYMYLLHVHWCCPCLFVILG